MKLVINETKPESKELTCIANHLSGRYDPGHGVERRLDPLCQRDDERRADPLLPVPGDLLEHLPGLGGRQPVDDDVGVPDGLLQVGDDFERAVHLHPVPVPAVRVLQQRAEDAPPRPGAHPDHPQRVAVRLRQQPPQLVQLGLRPRRSRSSPPSRQATERKLRPLLGESCRLRWSAGFCR
jgi:hypothetical protein